MPATCKVSISKKNKKRKPIGCGFHNPIGAFRRKAVYKNELDAWLTFLSADEPEIIARLIQHYPQFTPMYQQIYEICKNTERVMEMYSEELKILDRNTVQLMIDEMQDEIARKDKQIAFMSQQNERQLFEKNQEIASLKKQLAENQK